MDIENEYYQKLKRIVKNVGWGEQTKKENVEKINKEFDQVKLLFTSYMISQIKKKVNFITTPDLLDDLIDCVDKTFVAEDSKTARKQFKNYLSEFVKKDHEAIYKYQRNLRLYETDIGEGKRALENPSEMVMEMHFLNFNYTESISCYNRNLNEQVYFSSKEIGIHGELENQKNEINFGFGDEMDEDYKLIENLDDNEYLKNFKSFKYSQNSNYKNLLDYIDNDKFQVYIMGHSCGLSDRTLLNTIFEHEHCRSIKIFYHEREDGSDNFTEIVQNISRHFNDKKMMREKIVNKSLCQPLPQDIRFQEK